jgi:hypothetical protein
MAVATRAASAKLKSSRADQPANKANVAKMPQPYHFVRRVRSGKSLIPDFGNITSNAIAYSAEPATKNPYSVICPRTFEPISLVVLDKTSATIIVRTPPHFHAIQFLNQNQVH